MVAPGSDQAAGLLALAVDVAREAAVLVADHRLSGVDIAHTKSSATDIVTEADRASETLIRERLLGARPGDGFLGEEGSDEAGTSGVRWIVDPIDGTVNYAHDVPQYAVSIAAEVDGKVVAGVVLNPATGRTYTAVRGGGAFCDGRPIRVAEPVPIDHALVGTGFNYQREVRALQAASVALLLPRVGDIRRFGSCSLDLCAVAAGQLDGYVEEGIGGAWDYAAGGLIAQEAGARFEVLTGAAGRVLVAAAPASSYREFEDLIRSCGFLEKKA
jgi:myo-inositol-1(or 4)-monophosphatase